MCTRSHMAQCPQEHGELSATISTPATQVACTVGTSTCELCDSRPFVPLTLSQMRNMCHVVSRQRDYCAWLDKPDTHDLVSVHECSKISSVDIGLCCELYDRICHNKTSDVLTWLFK